MKKLALALAATAALVISVGSAAQAADKTKVCFIYVGTRTDGGWTQAHENGRLQVQKQFADKVETPFLESVPEGPDAERAIERMARSGCALIFTTSFGFMDATVKVAQKFPKVKFEHATGFKAAENLATYNSRFYEGRYIQGQIAAKMSKKGVAGYIASFPIPGSGDGYQRIRTRREVRQSGLQAEGRMGQYLVRPGQGSRRRQGADRPGR